jgi:hypothetical protein
MPGTLKLERNTTHPGSDLRQLEIQHNNSVGDLQQISFSYSDYLLYWAGVGPNSLTAPMGVGSTTSRVGLASSWINIAGALTVVAKSDAGTAFGSLGTIPTGTYGLIALDIIANGTVTFASAPLNYTTGYATEAAAILAIPARVATKARLGYITILAASPGFVVGTDALNGAGVTTTYYPYTGAFGATGIAANSSGIINSAGQGIQGVAGQAGIGFGSGIAWTGGKNGVLIPTVLSLGSTTTNVATTAFSYNANGLCDIRKAAVAAGTLLTGGTIPIDKWGIFVMLINGAGTITYAVGPQNTVTGYDTEAQAIRDLANIFPTSGLCQIGYFTVKTKSGTTFVAGTDGLAGGAVGNIASATNYYPTAGITYGQGITASQIAARNGVVLGSASY